MRKFLERVAEGRVVADGAMGTLLSAYGVKAGECHQYWNVTNANVVLAIHREYVMAGAEAVITNTFGANRISLARHRLDAELQNINRAGADVAREAAVNRAYVLGDIGPTGQLLQPLGELAPEQAEEAFAEQAKLLIDAGVDAIIVQTMTDLKEAACAARAVRKVSSIPLIVLMTFERQKDSYVTVMGCRPDEAVKELASCGCDIIGANCSLTASKMRELLVVFKAVTDLPVMLEPNAGQPKLLKQKVVYGESPETFASFAADLFDHGAAIVGGCCGTTPDHIGELVKKAR